MKDDDRVYTHSGERTGAMLIRNKITGAVSRATDNQLVSDEDSARGGYRSSLSEPNNLRLRSTLWGPRVSVIVG